MRHCDSHPVEWKKRAGHRLSNDVVELTMLTGGGHIVDFRLCGSPINLIWEAPWQTIDPQNFSSKHEALYGQGAVGQLLSGYSGHALVLGYFGMPSDAEVAQGLSLHGEAASAAWKLISLTSSVDEASLTMEVELPAYKLHCRRTITLRAAASSAAITETVTNLSDAPLDFQWVQHATFGPPLFAKDNAELFIPAAQAISWPLGYEGMALVADNAEFTWPNAPTPSGTLVNLARPFQREKTGFVVSVLTDPTRNDAYAAVLNRRLGLVAGYHFDRTRFPWIALWEENRARDYAPWEGITQVRGVEFGTSPMPLGLEQAQNTGTLFNTPVLTSISPGAEISTTYEIFATEVPKHHETISDVLHAADDLVIRFGDSGDCRVKSSNVGRSTSLNEGSRR
jgi:hypothetical protein